MFETVSLPEADGSWPQVTLYTGQPERKTCEQVFLWWGFLANRRRNLMPTRTWNSFRPVLERRNTRNREQQKPNTGYSKAVFLLHFFVHSINIYRVRTIIIYFFIRYPSRHLQVVWQGEDMFPTLFFCVAVMEWNAGPSGFTLALSTILSAILLILPRLVSYLFFTGWLGIWRVKEYWAHLHDGVILLLRPESFRLLLSCAN